MPATSRHGRWGATVTWSAVHQTYPQQKPASQQLDDGNLTKAEKAKIDRKADKILDES